MQKSGGEKDEGYYTNEQFADMMKAPEQYMHMAFPQRLSLDKLKDEFETYQMTESDLFISGERWGIVSGESASSPYRRYRCGSSSIECMAVRERMQRYFAVLVMEHDDLATTEQMSVLLSIGNNKAVRDGRELLIDLENYQGEL